MTEEKLEIHADMELIPVEEIDPNPWNPNRMGDEIYADTVAFMRRHGMVGAIYVRPHPEQNGKYRVQIVDGEHRFRAAKDLGATRMPCIVRELTDLEAKEATHNMDRLRGSPDPFALAQLIQDVSGELEPDDLDARFGFDEEDVSKFVDLLDLDTELLEQDDPDVVENGGGERPGWYRHVFSFEGDQWDIVRYAMSVQRLETPTRHDGNLLREICVLYLNQKGHVLPFQNAANRERPDGDGRILGGPPDGRGT